MKALIPSFRIAILYLLLFIISIEVYAIDISSIKFERIGTNRDLPSQFVYSLIQDQNGFINQFLGDGIMALFLEEAADAVKASLDIQGVINEYNKELIESHAVTLSIGIGLHSGSLIMGILGDKERMDANVVSDTVNTASRMEGLTKHFGAPVIISEDTLNSLNGSSTITSRFLGNIQVKGKSETVKIYEIIEANIKKSFNAKLATKETFDKGVEEYLNKSFTSASVHFEKVLKENPDDKATKLYIKKAADYMVKGVPADWKGKLQMEDII